MRELALRCSVGARDSLICLGERVAAVQLWVLLALFLRELRRLRHHFPDDPLEVDAETLRFALRDAPVSADVASRRSAPRTQHAR